MGCLYQLTSPSGKNYLGISTKTCDERWAKHIEHAMGKREAGALYNAIRKYGYDAFTRRTLVIANDWKYLCDLERRAIVQFGSMFPNGYNVAPGGEGVIGPRDAKAKERISIAQKRRFENPIERARLAAFGRKGNSVTRRPSGYKPPWKIRQIAKRIKERLTPEALSASIKSAMAKPDVMAKMKACAIARSSDPSWRAKISQSKKGKKLGPMSEEHRKAHSEAAKRMWELRKANG